MKIEFMAVNDGEVSEVLAFAKEELEKYLTLMGMPAIRILLGKGDLTLYGLPRAEDPEVDDQYLIDVEPDGGLILGSNDRSVLLGVYRYLTLIGCKFLRPGKAGEVIPVKTMPSEYRAKDRMSASLRHRGVCIEGADSIEHILDFLDWCPKVGLNSFFFQMKYPYIFLERYYERPGKGGRKPIEWSREDTERVSPAFFKAAEKRGLLEHRMGHGWTSAVIDLTAAGWDRENVTLGEAQKELVAEVGGKRDLFYGVPTNTNLCLSNPKAMEKYADLVVDYVRENPKAAYVHLWLADGWNNSCECEECNKIVNGKKRRPSDHYFRLLNYIDERMTKEGLTARLVMLLYVDLMWAPQVEKLKNPKRFVMMFAPITRTFEHAFEEHGELPADIPFTLNRNNFASDLEANLWFLKEWQKAAEGCDAFDYDYYMGRAHYGDPTYINLSRIIVKDLKYMKQLGLNGISSCQELRSQFPNGLANYCMGRCASDTSLTFEELSQEYYRDCYGRDGEKLLALMEELSDCFWIDYFMKHRPLSDPEYAKRLEKVPETLEKILDLKNAHRPTGNTVQENMWQELDFFAKYTQLKARIFSHLSLDELSEALKVFEEEFEPLVWKKDLMDGAWYDAFRETSLLGNLVRLDRTLLGVPGATF